MRPLVLISVMLVSALAAAQGRGVPQNGYPDWAERMVQVYTNRSRADPVADLAGCALAVCKEKGCYTTPMAPVVYNYANSRAARFHSANLKLTNCFQHRSPCALVSDISSKWDPNPGCDGSAACACQGGTFQCETTTTCTSCTATGARVSLFGGSMSGENLAYGYGSPRRTYYAWFWEQGDVSTCVSTEANGHRFNMLVATHKSLGVGRYVTHYSQDFGGNGTGAITAALVSGGHEVVVSGDGKQFMSSSSAATNAVELRANYYDPGGAPLSAKVNVDGTCTDMTLERGTGGNAVYLSSQSLTGNACRKYVFTFKDSTGALVYLPETGSYGLGADLTSCPDWTSSTPQACGGGGNTAPIILTQAAASPSTVTGTGTQLSVVAGDDTGEGSLSYSWAASPATGVTFSVNGNNAAKATAVTFSQPGSYGFTVTVTDPGALATTSSVNVTVERTPVVVTVAPPAVTVAPAASQQFTATVKDQFNQQYATPVVTWIVTDGGTIDSAGLFTAGAVDRGPAEVRATSGAATGSAFVTVSSGPADTTAPQVFFTSPANGATASGTMTLAAAATDETGVAKVIFFADNVQVGEDDSAPYTAIWNADAAGPGAHALRARAVDFAGNAADASISVVVAGGVSPDAGTDAGTATDGGSDLGSPVVTLISPAAGATVAPSVDVEASATDDRGVVMVELRADGVTFATLTSPPWRASLAAAGLDDGEHELSATARDASGNQGASPAVRVTVDGGKGCGCQAGGAAALGWIALAAALLRSRRRAR